MALEYTVFITTTKLQGTLNLTAVCFLGLTQHDDSLSTSLPDLVHSNIKKVKR
jgi:hypothetical protein